MIINFIGNYSVGYVGEKSDICHLTDEMEILGHSVQRVPQDIWKAICDGEQNEAWEDNLPDPKADINIICKWGHFNKDLYIEKLKEWTNAPVFYFVWDWMDGFPHGHFEMVYASDLYISNDVFHPQYKNMPNCYYFPMDVSSKEFDRVTLPKKYDVTFFGSYIGQGDRIEWLKKINETYPIKIFSWNWQEWKREGFDAEQAVYGQQFAEKVAESKIVLGFNVNDHTWGYWSNRVGKVLTVGGFLLYRYVPGMELFLRDGAEYFSSPDEATEKIKYYLEHDEEREKIAQRGYEIGRDRFTSEARVKELMILIERFLKK